MSFKLKSLLITLCIISLLSVAGFVYSKYGNDLTCSKKSFDNLPQLQVGDVLLRMGTGVDSYVIVTATDSTYSHVAMVASVNPIKVIHATTDDVDESKNMVIEQSLEDFLDNARSLGVMRYPLDEKDRSKIATYLQKKLGIAFVLNGAEGDFYCSTLVYEALSQVQDMTMFKTVFVDSAFLEGYFLLPDAFFHDKRAHLIYAQ